MEYRTIQSKHGSRWRKGVFFLCCAILAYGGIWGGLKVRAHLQEEEQAVAPAEEPQAEATAEAPGEPVATEEEISPADIALSEDEVSHRYLPQPVQQEGLLPSMATRPLTIEADAPSTLYVTNAEALEELNSEGISQIQHATTRGPIPFEGDPAQKADVTQFLAKLHIGGIGPKGVFLNGRLFKWGTPIDSQGQVIVKGSRDGEVYFEAAGIRYSQKF